MGRHIGAAGHTLGRANVLRLSFKFKCREGPKLGRQLQEWFFQVYAFSVLSDKTVFIKEKVVAG